MNFNFLFLFLYLFKLFFICKEGKYKFIEIKIYSRKVILFIRIFCPIRKKKLTKKVDQMNLDHFYRG